jgi:hypothetical protein
MGFVQSLIKIQVFFTRYKTFEYMQTCRHPPLIYLTRTFYIYIYTHTYIYIHTHIYTHMCSHIRPGYDTLLQVCLTLLFKISRHRPCCMLNIAKSPYAVTKLKPIICPYWHYNRIMMPEFQSVHLLGYDLYCRSQWPRGLMRRSAAARLLRGALAHWSCCAHNKTNDSG